MTQALYAAAPAPEPADVDDELAAALARFLGTTQCPLYLRTPATAWLAQRA